MKRIIALMLACVMAVSGCGSVAAKNQNATDVGTSNIKEEAEVEVPDDIEEVEEQGEARVEQTAEVDEELDDAVPSEGDLVDSTIESLNIDDYQYETEEVSFDSLNDQNLLQYVQDSVYAGLEEELHSDDYVIEGVDAIYISKEYIEELEYNSQANVFFGYTLAELEEQFQGKKYIFTLGDNGETTVVEFDAYDDTYEKALKNVAIGTGVILLCVTVSVATAVAAPPVSIVFAASAKNATRCAVESGAFAAIASAVVEGYKTGDFESALKAAALTGSEAFKWGAIVGAVTGGLVKTHELNTIRTPEQSEAAALELFKGKKQVTFLNGKEVPYGTKGATRPDVVRTVGDHLEAIEVKNYDLRNTKNVRALLYELKRQVAERALHMPEGTTQRIVLDVRGRHYPKELTDLVIKYIQSVCSSAYPNIPVELMTI